VTVDVVGKAPSGDAAAAEQRAAMSQQ
jgi:hypothetical protein